MFGAALISFGIWMMIGAFFIPKTTVEAVVMFVLGLNICAPVVVIYLARRRYTRVTVKSRSDLIAKAAEDQEKRIEQPKGKPEKEQ